MELYDNHEGLSLDKVTTSKKDEDERMLFPFKKRYHLIFEPPNRLLAKTTPPPPSPKEMCIRLVLDENTPNGLVEVVVLLPGSQVQSPEGFHCYCYPHPFASLYSGPRGRLWSS